jgi:DNA polymerase I
LMKRQGYVSSMFGRRRRFMFLNEQNLDEARKSSCNMPIQSAASDITLLALVELVKRGYKVVLTVHDSIVVEAAKEGAAETAAAIRKAMVDSAARWISDVPFAVDVEISERWSKF